MKAVKILKKSGFILTGIFVCALNFSAQTENPPVNIEKPAEVKIVPAETPKIEVVKVDTPKVETDGLKTKSDAPSNFSEVKTETVATPNVKAEAQTTMVKTDDKSAQNGDESSEAAEILPYYNNYLKEYRLGPNDVVSIEVFGQCPDYCIEGKTVPPTARISYPLIREGVLVGGRTVEEVAAEITKKLDEYIIDPKVTVTLDKAMSVRYSVMGKVVAPGIRIMDRKVSLYEAIIEAGGISKDGNKKKIALIRFDAQGRLSRQDVNLAEIETGKSPMIYLNPGDQVFVSGKGFTIDKAFDYLGKVSVVRLLFGSPF